MNKALLKKFIEGKCSREELEYLSNYFDSDDHSELDVMIRKTWNDTSDSDT